MRILEGTRREASGKDRSLCRQQHCEAEERPQVLPSYLCLVFDFVGSLLKLADFSDNMGDLWEGRGVLEQSAFSCCLVDEKGHR